MLLEISGLTKSFGQLTILKELSFSLQSGRLSVLVGSNGAGKTTLLRILSGLLGYDQGIFLLDGEQISLQSPLWRGQVGLVSHKTFLYQNLTGLENLRFFSRLYQQKLSQSQLTEKLDQVGIRRAADRLVRSYSRGMQQRLTIARALLPQPTVLILDEPFTGLDSEGSQRLLKILEEQIRAEVMILMTTHDPQATHTITDSYLRLSRARLSVSDQYQGQMEPIG